MAFCNISFIFNILWNREIILLMRSDNFIISLVRSSANTGDKAVFVFFVLSYVLAISFPCTSAVKRFDFLSVFLFRPPFMKLRFSISDDCLCVNI